MILSSSDNNSDILCTKCNQLKDRSFFYSNGKSFWCKPCSRIYSNKRRRARVEWLWSLKKDIPCKDCGKIYEPFCMDYDHLRDKADNISRLVLNNTPKERILKEIEKCELVCVLCHNKRTHNRKNKNIKGVKHITRNVNIINEAKNVPCAICSNTHGHYNMQFDHIDSDDKYSAICQLKSCKLETLLNEIAKCQVLCALCHRRKSITEQRARVYKVREKPEKKPKPFLDIDNQLKECIKCKVILDFDAFQKSNKYKIGLEAQCKECWNEYRRARRSKFKLISKTYIDIDKKLKGCTKCKEVLHFDNFFKSTETKIGLTSWCRGCSRENVRERRVKLSKNLEIY